MSAERMSALTAMNESPIFCFGQFRLDPINQELWRGSKLVEVRRKTFEVLLFLVRNPRRLITRDELVNGVWTGSKVSGGLLRAYIWELRRVLGDAAVAPRYLETFSGRGYRFVQHVRLEERQPDASDDAAEGDSSVQPNADGVEREAPASAR